MSVQPTEIIERAGLARTIARQELCNWTVNNVRTTLYSMMRDLMSGDDDVDHDYASNLVVFRNRLLTNPVYFTEYANDLLHYLGSIRSPYLYGKSFTEAFDILRLELNNLAEVENPMHERIAEVVYNALVKNRQLRIYCHPGTTALYKKIVLSLLDINLDDVLFFYSHASYSRQPLFDDLLLTGPIRSRGWNRTPDAVVSAPRFQVLHQITWEGVHDDFGVGYDPVVAREMSRNQVLATGAERTKVEQQKGFIGFDSSVVRMRSKGSLEEPFTIEDELHWSRDTTDQERQSKAHAVGLADGLYLFCAPRTPILSWDLNDEEFPVRGRSCIDQLHEDMYVIIELNPDDSHESATSHINSLYTLKWKSILQQRIENDVHDLVRRLRQRGVAIKTLGSRVLDWAKEDSPRKYQHFELLIDELGLSHYDVHQRFNRQGAQFARKAYKIISKSWGEAISTGRERNEIKEQQRIALFNHVKADITSIAHGDVFEFPLRTTTGEHELFEFVRITDIEPGFMVPADCMNYKITKHEVDNWRR